MIELDEKTLYYEWGVLLDAANKWPMGSEERKLALDRAAEVERKLIVLIRRNEPTTPTPAN